MAASTPAGAIPGGAITPGHTQSTGVFGYGDAFDNSTDFSAQVMTGLITFRPRKPSGPEVTIPNTNLVNLTVDTQGVFANGCWLIPASDLIVNPDFSATLTFDSADPNVVPCPGDPVGTTAIGAAPAQPADGSVQGFVGEVKATMSWTPASPVLTTRSTVKETCRPFASIAEGTQAGTASTVSGTIATTIEGYNYFLNQVIDVPVNAQLPDGYGNLNTNTYNLNINGPATGQCGQFGAP